MAEKQRETKAMPKDWNLIEIIYEDALPGQREAQARDVSRRMGLTIIGFLQAHPDQHFTFRYRVSKNNRRNIIEQRHHSIDVVAVETLHEMQALPMGNYGDMSRIALSHSALEEIGRRVRGRWLRIKSRLRRQ